MAVGLWKVGGRGWGWEVGDGGWGEGVSGRGRPAIAKAPSGNSSGFGIAIDSAVAAPSALPPIVWTAPLLSTTAVV